MSGCLAIRITTQKYARNAKVRIGIRPENPIKIQRRKRADNVVKKSSKAAPTSSIIPPAAMLAKNLFCSRVHLTNEASVEKLFIDRLLEHLGFGDGDVLVKTSIQELKVGSVRHHSISPTT
jgi:hypothetical protein